MPINGKWRHGKDARVLRDLNPYSEEVVVEIPHASRDDMDKAYRGAAKAQVEWADALPGERAAVMRRAAQVMEARGLRFAQQLETGMAHVNDQPVNDLPYNPFGGEKDSGLGRFNGIWAVTAFTTDQWVTIQHTPRCYRFDARVIKGVESGGG